MLFERQKSGAWAPVALLATMLPALCFADSAAHASRTAEAFATRAHASSRFPVRARANLADGSLSLNECITPPSAQLPAGAHWTARTLVQVRCDSKPRWSILIPIDIESEVPVLVLRSAVARGSRLEDTDVQREVRWVSGTSADYVNSSESLGRHHLRRNLGAGSVLTADDLEPDTLIKRGQLVTVIAELGGARIQADAIALADARSGDRLRLQNRGSLKVIEGMVDNEGAVRVLP